MYINAGVARLVIALRLIGFLLFAALLFVGFNNDANHFWFPVILGTIVGSLFFGLAWIINGFAMRR